MDTARRHVCYDGHPGRRAVFTGAGVHYRCQRAVSTGRHTGSVNRPPVLTYAVSKKHCTTMPFVNTASQH